MRKVIFCAIAALFALLMASQARAQHTPRGTAVDISKAEIEATVKIRSRHPGVAARIRPLADRRVEIDFAHPQRGVTPGQAAVFYQGTRVLGGCWIEGRL